jgi:HSP20 family protein
MPLVRWRPMRDLIDIQDEINRMFEDFARPHEGESTLPRLHPAIDVMENKDSFVVKAELPGLKKEDVKVTLQNNVLIVSGEKKQESQEKGKNFYRTERSYGSFYRTIDLPVSVKMEDIKADFKDGVLTIELPKVEEAKPKEINISVK